MDWSWIAIAILAWSVVVFLFARGVGRHEGRLEAYERVGRAFGGKESAS